MNIEYIEELFEELRISIIDFEEDIKILKRLIKSGIKLETSQNCNI
jgi:hypothetical protein